MPVRVTCVECLLPDITPTRAGSLEVPVELPDIHREFVSDLNDQVAGLLLAPAEMGFEADDVVYRRVSSEQLETDHSTGRQRPTSANFSDSTRPGLSPMSCIAHSLLNRTISSFARAGGWGDLLVAFTVADLLEWGKDAKRQAATCDPLPVGRGTR